MNQTCSNCGGNFKCKSNDIIQCQCNTIQLSDEELIFVSNKFDKCLCANCLKELQSEYMNSTEKGFPE